MAGPQRVILDQLSGDCWLIDVRFAPDEIEYDGFRLMLQRDRDRVRLITKGGYDWTKRYPRIVEATLKNRQTRFVIDDEAIIRGVDGYSDFNALHSGRHNDEAELVAFDVLALDGDDLRTLALSLRKTNLQRLPRAGRKASSSATLSKARSARIYTARRASLDLKVWSPSEPMGPTVEADRRHPAFERVKESFA